MKKGQILSVVGFIVVALIVYQGFRIRQHADQTRSHADKHPITTGSSPNFPTEATGKSGVGSMDGTATMDNPEGKYVSRYGGLPSMMAGTRIDGELLADNEGRLIILPTIKRRFEYFLTGVSQEGMDTCVARIRENIQQSLPPSAATDANKILDTYLGYKNDLKSLYNEAIQLPQSSSQVDALKTMVEKRKELRRKFMTPEVVNAFFGDEEIYDDFSLKRMALFYNPTLSEDAKQKALRKLEDQLPEDMRERKKREQDVAKLMEKYKTK